MGSPIEEQPSWQSPTQPGRPPLLQTLFAPSTPLPRPHTTLSSPREIPSSQDSMADDTFWVATQQAIDPRRLGQQSSGLEAEDLADIVCLLHPNSMPAYLACAQIHQATPQYTLTSNNNVIIKENDNGNIQDVGTFELATQGMVACDIAIRLSAKLKDPVGGFHFGRNGRRCDFVLGGDDHTKRISNVHFRIYINEYGIVMLEDQSTNGTAVDGILLRGKDKENGKDYRHTLDNGSVIVLTMTPPEEDYRFVVRVPQRDGASDDAYCDNVTKYFLRTKNVPTKNEARDLGTGDVIKGNPPDIFRTQSPTQVGRATPGPSALSGRQVSKEWRGGDRYNKIGMIGRGAFATVYKITAKFDGVPYAAKELEKRRFMKNGILDQKVDMEMKIMRNIKHANVVEYIEHIDWDEHLYIIMEYVPGGDLGSLINSRGRLPEADVRTMAIQLLSALKYLHDKSITHRDVKPDNILIYSNDPFHVKLTDFGLSKMIESEETFLRTFCGTLLYCAPEVYSEYREYDSDGRRNPRGIDRKALPPQRYGQAVDIWSTAGVLFYALCGSPPYPVKNGTSYQELLNHIMTQPLDIRPLQRAGISDRAIRFVRRMLHVRPEHRATINELETNSWLVGGDSMEISMDDDEVDQVGSSFLDPDLEEGASQLSIMPNRQIEDSQEDDLNDDNLSELTEFQPREIPSSFNTSEGEFSNGNNSFAYPTTTQAQGQDRPPLFGEVNVSAVGSSGAIPMGHLNLPISSRETRPDLGESRYLSFEDSRYGEPGTQISEVNNLRHEHPLPPAMLGSGLMPPPPRVASDNSSHAQVDDRSVRSSSLMGAESMVGHLNMHSPGSAVSPGAEYSSETGYSRGPDSPAPTIELGRDATISLRRPRDEDNEEIVKWQPPFPLAKRQRRSEREINMPLPPTIFWDAADKSTHHYDYPKMMSDDYQAYSEFAKMNGEKFVPGGKTFERTMQSFRSSRSPSIENDGRAHSEPTNDGRRILMRRDERRLSEDGPTGVEGTTPAATRRPLLDETLPPTAYTSNAPSPLEVNNDIRAELSQPVVCDDFHPPKRVLAKALGTSDSCLPTLGLNFVDSLTSWGRGYNATARTANLNEVKIPKYAFKVLFFKSGYYSRAVAPTNGTHIFNSEGQDMRFYISTKASVGIWVNDVHIPAVDSGNPDTKSEYWGELRHNDLITVWRHDCNPSLYNRLRFDCLWGGSRKPRNVNEPFHLLPAGTFLDEVEEVALVEEKAILNEKRRREDEEIKRTKEEKQRDQLARQIGTVSMPAPKPKPVDYNQSFSIAP